MGNFGPADAPLRRALRISLHDLRLRRLKRRNSSSLREYLSFSLLTACRGMVGRAVELSVVFANDVISTARGAYNEDCNWIGAGSGGRLSLR